MQVYFAPPKGVGLAEQMDRFAVDKFRNPADLKDKYKASDCHDAWDQQLLEFLGPILYLEKPTWITVTVANTIFGALEDRKIPAPRPVNWGWLIHNIVEKLAGIVSSWKTTLICPYLFHLYHFKEVLSELEGVDYKKGESLLKYGLSSKEEPGYSESDEEEHEDVPEPQPEKKTFPTGPHRKHTNPASRGVPDPTPALAPAETSRQQKHMKDPFEETIKWLRHVKGVKVRLATANQEVTRALGLPDFAEEPTIFDAISRRPPPEVTLSFQD